MEQLGLSVNVDPMPVVSGIPVAGPGPAAEPCGNVTEVILPPGQVENFQLLLPMLTQLNQERRWLAWIDPPAELVSKWQTMHGIIANELLVLRSNRDYSAFELARRALGAGTCHAVVTWTTRLSGRDFRALEQASARGRSHGVILRCRQGFAGASVKGVVGV